VGKVLCSRHGVTGGPCICDHVNDAVNSSSSGKSVENNLATVRFEVDALGDGAIVLTYLTCTSCAALCQIQEGDVVTFEHLDQFPVMNGWAPTCYECIDEWTSRS